jgi:hypothetical protein
VVLGLRAVSARLLSSGARGRRDRVPRERTWIMTVRYFALVLGIIFLLIGIMGFIPAFVTHPADTHALTVHASHGYLLGLFPVNVLHNLVHILFGIWGIAAYGTGFDASRVYARSVAIVYALVTIMGLIPGLNTVFGLMPIHGNDIWLHAVIAVAAAYFGWAVLREPAAGRMATDTGTTSSGAGPSDQDLIP